MAPTDDYIHQEAELRTFKDGKQYILSHEKEARIGGPGEKKGDDLVAYIIHHADVVRDYKKPDYSSCTVKAAKE